MIVLANRPGFPFLGNDFFGAMGMYTCTGMPIQTYRHAQLHLHGSDKIFFFDSSSPSPIYYVNNRQALACNVLHNLLISSWVPLLRFGLKKKKSLPVTKVDQVEL